MRHQLPLVFIDAVVRAGSIRKAAQSLAITSTALNRRILAMEEELGASIFERVPNGVRLSAAGELFIHHARTQMADLERVRAQIADLSGERRGHVSIASNQALMHSFLPMCINQYRQLHPSVTFTVRVCGRSDVEERLGDYSADIALIHDPEPSACLHVLGEATQPLRAQFSRRHPLSCKQEVRLSECLEWPLALPTMANSVRQCIERTTQAARLGLEVAVESDNHHFLQQCLLDHRTVSLQIAVGLDVDGADDTLCSRPIDVRDVPLGRVIIAQWHGRHLSVTAARFAHDACALLSDWHQCDEP